MSGVTPPDNSDSAKRVSNYLGSVGDHDGPKSNDAAERTSRAADRVLSFRRGLSARSGTSSSLSGRASTSTDQKIRSQEAEASKRREITRDELISRRNIRKDHLERLSPEERERLDQSAKELDDMSSSSAAEARAALSSSEALRKAEEAQELLADRNSLFSIERSQKAMDQAAIATYTKPRK